MRVVGLALGIGSSASLAATIANAGHLDELVVVSVEDDQPTRILCKSRAVTCVLHRSGRGEGELGKPAGKLAAFYTGIRHLVARSTKGPKSYPMEDTWVVIFHEGVLLPVDFRECVMNLRAELDAQRVYSCNSVRACRRWEEFDSLAQQKLWEPSQGLPTGNHVTLFSLAHAAMADPAAATDAVSKGRPSLHELVWGGAESLPFTCLYLDPKQKTRFINRDGQSVYSLTERQATSKASAVRRLLDLGAGSGREAKAVVLGCEASEIIGLFAARFQNVYLDDLRRVTYFSEDKLKERDRAFRWGRMAPMLRSFQNVAFLSKLGNEKRRPWKGAVVKPSDGMADVLFIGVEPTHDYLLKKLPESLRLLKPDGLVCGTHYGLPGFPQTTSAIELLLGGVDAADEEGGWALRLTPGRRRQIGGYEKLAKTLGTIVGIVVFIFDQHDGERALTALHSLRRVWSGSICVMKWGAEEPALRMMCALQQVPYVQVRDPFIIEQEGGKITLARPCVNRDVARLVSLEQSPFARTLWVAPDGRIPRAEKWLDGLSKQTPLVFGNDTTKRHLGTLAHLRGSPASRAVVRRYLFPPAKAEMPSAEVLRANFLRLPCARVLRGHFPRSLCNEVDAAAAIQLFRARVRVPEGAVVITAVTLEDIDALMQNWEALHWPEGTRRIVYLEGIELAALGDGFLPGSEVRKLDPAIMKEFPNEPHWTWAILSAALHVTEPALVYVDPYLKASPGAQLFGERRYAEAPYCSPGWTFLPLSKGARKIAKIGPPASLFHTAWLRGALDEFRGQKAEKNFEVFLHDFATSQGKPAPVIDVLTCGWNG